MKDNFCSLPRIGRLAWTTASVALAALASSSATAAGPDPGTQSESQIVQHFEREVIPRPNSPNIIYIVLDDVGFADLGSYGSEIRTPNMDRLAAQGLRYTNFRTKAICSPTRAALLTGRNSHTVGMSNVSNLLTGLPSGQGRIDPAAATLAEVVQSGGYRTYAVGKWHLNSSQTSTRSQWPLGEGFDRFYGFLEGMTNQYHPELILDNSPIDAPERPGYHLSTDLVDHAIKYIATDTAVSPERPFFLYLAFGAAHAPHQVPKRYIDKYVDVFKKGWDQTRADRLKRQKLLGIAPADAQLAPRNPGIEAWSNLKPEQRDVNVRFEAAYAGFLEHTDEQVGRLLEFLQRAGRLENTIVVLLSDNGGDKEGGFTGTLNDLHGLTRRPENVHEMASRLQEFGQESTLENYPMGWTQASNTPFPYYKTTQWDGGIRTPMIVSWPAQIPSKGQVRSQMVDAIDVTPTVLSLIGMSMPPVYKGVPQLPVAGKSIAATFANPAAPPARHTQYFELAGQRSIWHDGWNAVAEHEPGTSFDQDRWRLFDTNHDFAGIHDIAEQHRDKLEEMKRLWFAEAKQYGAVPMVDAPVADSMTPGQGAGVSKVTVGLKLGRDPRPHYVFYPEQESLSMWEAPVLRGRAYSLTARTKPLTGKEEGVLFANGDQFGGYAMYLKGGDLVFAYNDLGTSISRVAGRADLKGATSLGYSFERTSQEGGTGRLFVDGKQVAAAPIKAPDALLTALGGFDVGRDGNGQVVPDYSQQGAFAFAPGMIDKIVVDVE